MIRQWSIIIALVITGLLLCIDAASADDYQEHHRNRKARAARARAVDQIVEDANEASEKNVRACIRQHTKPGATSAERVIVRSRCRRAFRPIRTPRPVDDY